MGKYTKTDVVTGDVVKSDVNVQLGLIETAINDNFSLSGGAGNALAADIDINSNDILNVTRLFTDQLYLNGQLITDVATGSPVTGVTDQSAGYNWTGTHTFTILPTVSGNNILHQGNINEAVVSINAQSGTAYTTVLSDRAGLITMSSSSSNTITIPPNSSAAYPVGTVLSFSQIGTGQTTIVAGAGVTLSHVSGLVLTGQYGMASAIQTAANSWIVSGSLTV
tara:strand:+ start:1798 stop:2466 length:669 start_codon:yes stop_codon:yes gene_type:complete